MSTTFGDIVSEVVSQFNECEEKDSCSLGECIESVLIYNCDILTVIAQLANVDKYLDCSIHQYAFNLLFDHLIDNSWVHLIDD